MRMLLASHISAWRRTMDDDLEQLLTPADRIGSWTLVSRETTETSVIWNMYPAYSSELVSWHFALNRDPVLPLNFGPHVPDRPGKAKRRSLRNIVKTRGTAALSGPRNAKSPNIQVVVSTYVDARKSLGDNDLCEVRSFPSYAALVLPHLRPEALQSSWASCC